MIQAVKEARMKKHFFRRSAATGWLLALLVGFGVGVVQAGDPGELVAMNSQTSRAGTIQITLVDKKNTHASALEALEFLDEHGSSDALPQTPVTEQNASVSSMPSPVALPEETTKRPDKEIYLTFDDGPLNGTQNVLRVLREEGVPATMFFIGRHVQKRPDLFAEAKSIPNIMIANHTYCHANGHYRRYYHDTYGVMSDIEHAQLIIGGRKYLRLAGRNVWRTPEVRRDDWALGRNEVHAERIDYDTLAREGFFVYGWDAEWHFDHHSDRPLGDAETLARKIESIFRHGRSVKKGKIILLAHDFMFRDARSTAQLRRFIRIMRERGWRFKKIDQYSRYRPEPLYVAKYYKKSPTKLARVEIKPRRIARKSLSMPKRTSPTVARRAIAMQQHRRSLQAQLIDAVRSYAAAQVERLLAHGARVNRRDEYGRIALNTAVKANSIFLVKKLLSKGANLYQRDGHGATALQVAKQYNREAIEKYLISVAHRGTAASVHTAPIVSESASTGSLQRKTMPMQEATAVAVAAQPVRRNPLEALR